MQNIATFLHIILGAVIDNAVPIVIVLGCVVVLATIARVVWDLAAWEQRQHDRHEATHTTICPACVLFGDVKALPGVEYVVVRCEHHAQQIKEVA